MPPAVPAPLESLLRRCTAVVEGESRGTGFFVAPKTLVTCAHVVQDSATEVVVRWSDRTFAATVDRQPALEAVGLLLLRIETDGGIDHPCVQLASSVHSGDAAYAYGFSDLRPDGEPVLLTVEGVTGGAEPLIKLAHGQIRPGMSGSPLLNVRTGRVCGVIRKTRDRSADLGGLAIPVDVLLALESVRQQAATSDAVRWNAARRKISGARSPLDRLRQTVRTFWVDEYRSSALFARSLMPIRMRFDTQRVARPIDRALRDVPPKDLGQDLPMADLFEELDERLLILGGAGTGKTIALVQLAEALLDRADDDRGAPVPVIVHLGSWRSGQAIRAWLGEQVKLLHPQVLPRHTDEYVSQRRLVVLFDGLDEVSLDQRPACIRALNAFLDQTGIAAAVSCRTAGYEEAGVPLGLNGAAELLPLSVDEIRGYIAREMPHVADVRARLENDEALLELAHTPLMLQLFLSAYDEKTARDSATAAPGEGRSRLFKAFISAMYRRRGDDRVASGEMNYNLASLAQALDRASQPVFHLENVQPTWLVSPSSRQTYILISRMAFWFLAIGPRSLSTLAAWLVAGAATTWFDMRRLDTKTRSSTAGGIVSATLIGIGSVFIVVVLSVFANVPDLDPLLWPACLVLLAMQMRKHGIGRDIRTFEQLHWSWRTAARKALISSLVVIDLLAVTIVTVDLIVKHPVGNPVEGFVTLGGWVAVTVFVFGGWSRGTHRVKVTLNQGIHMTWKNALSAGLAVGSVVFVAMISGAVAFELMNAGQALPVTVTDLPWADARWNLFFKFGVVPVLLFGGNDVLRHYILRWLLHRDRILPFNARRFLEYGAHLGFLHRVGGGFIFAHRSLQDHFAAGNAQHS